MLGHSRLRKILLATALHHVYGCKQRLIRASGMIILNVNTVKGNDNVLKEIPLTKGNV